MNRINKFLRMAQHEQMSAIFDYHQLAAGD